VQVLADKETNSDVEQARAIGIAMMTKAMDDRRFESGAASDRKKAWFQATTMQAGPDAMTRGN